MKTYLLVLVSIFLPVIAFAQKAITGQVLDNLDEPIIGASVLEKGHLMEPLLIWMEI